MADGIIAPFRGEKYILMRRWLELFQAQSNLYIWGAGNRGKQILRWLKIENIAIIAFIDRDITLEGKEIEGLPVLTEGVLKENSKVIISPYDYEEIEESLKEKGFKINNDYFVSRQIEIPNVDIKIFLDNDMFHHIREKIGSNMQRPFPVYLDDRIVDYYKLHASFEIYDKALDFLISGKVICNLRYLKIPRDGIILQEWDELSEKINKFFNKNQTLVRFDSKLLECGYAEILAIKENSYDMKESSECLMIEQNFGFLIDLLTYNEILDAIPHIRKLQEKEINFVLARLPEISELKEISESERFRSENNITGYSQFSDEREEQVKKVYGNDYERWKNREIGNIIQYYVGNRSYLKDTTGEYTNVKDGIRYTVFQPLEYYNSVHVMGPCIVGGAYVADNGTIPSILQIRLNESYPNTYKVENHGICGGIRSYLERVKELDLYRGDYLIFIDTFPKEILYECEDIIFIDLLGAIESRDQDIFFEKPIHLNCLGNQILANEIYFEIVWKFCEEKRLIQKGNILMLDIESEFEGYKEKLWEIKREIPDGMNCGAIVMNCNPFTNGHLYLIERARKLIDFLIVFVVEEDKSFFSFQKRLEMVKAACEPFDNVLVLSMGKLVLSSYTMPEYFKKDELQNILIDPAKDVEIFATFVAPELNITKRFVGEEPFDTVTRQYNECMKERFPQYGIELVELPRLIQDGGVISATVVRRLIKENNIEQIRRLVPQTTFAIIKEMMV